MTAAAKKGEARLRLPRRPRLLTAVLREERVVGFAPLDAGRQRVDPERGVIFGVKVVGKTSPNTHGVRGAESTEYTPEALQAALPLYEGLKVNIDHPPRQQPQAERSSLDRLGKLQNARIAGGEIFADLHLLKSHPMAGRLLEAAELMPDAFALSHNALGRGEVKGGRYVVTEIPEVRSVDVVADGGTNTSLFEGREVKQQIALRDLCEGRAELSQKLAPLFRAWPGALTMLVEAEEGGDGGDYRDHLHMARKLCEDAGDLDTAGKIHKLMAPEKAQELEEDSEDALDDASAGGGKAEEEKKAMEESKKRVTRLARGFLNLRENEQPSAKLVEALAKLPDDDSRLSLLESWPRGQAAQQPARGGQAPRSAPGVQPVRESAAAKSADELAVILLR